MLQQLAAAVLVFFRVAEDWMRMQRTRFNVDHQWLQPDAASAGPPDH